MNGQPATAIRDTGADIICVKGDLVDASTETLGEITLRSFSSRPEKTRVVAVELTSPFVSGCLEVAVVENLCKPVLLGNVATFADGRRVTLPFYSRG
jgi:hypothetical protein